MSNEEVACGKATPLPTSLLRRIMKRARSDSGSCLQEYQSLAEVEYPNQPVHLDHVSLNKITGSRIQTYPV